jgi:hypothetical protein
MTPLPPVIHKAGFELTLIRRLGRVAIYRQHWPGGNPDHDAYEVILPQVRNTNHEGQLVAPMKVIPQRNFGVKRDGHLRTLPRLFGSSRSWQGRPLGREPQAVGIVGMSDKPSLGSADEPTLRDPGFRARTSLGLSAKGIKLQWKVK